MAVFLTREFNLDIEPGALPPILKVKQYDGDGTKTYIATFFNDGNLYSIPSSVSKVRVEGTKPDGTGFSYNCTKSANTITFSLTRQMTTVYGDVYCDFVFYDSSENSLGSQSFILHVHRAEVQQDQIESQDDFRTLVSYVNDAEAYKNWSKSYAVGGTGLRVDEETNNSNYNASLAKSYSSGDSGIRTGEETDNSSYYRTMSKSWAQGDTGIRDGENTNNSKYWCQSVNDARRQIDLNELSINSLQSQINQYVAPSTQQPDEVVNARVGFDGTIYPTLGTAIRSQMTKFGYVSANEEIYFSNNT